MARKILLSLLVSAGGILNCMATVAKECKDFASQIVGTMEEIEGSALPTQEKKKINGVKQLRCEGSGKIRIARSIKGWKVCVIRSKKR
jgi:hypothetical protein